MAEQLVFDLDRSTPNVALERLRQAVLSTDDLYLLADVLLGLIGDAQAAVDAADAERTQLRADLDALAARVTALEPITAPPEETIP